MFTINNYSLLLVVCLVSSVSANDASIREMHDLVFAMDGEPLGPENTYESLKTLQGLMETSARRYKAELPEIQKLIEFGNINDEKCNLANVTSVTRAIELNIEFATNILPYLEHYRLKQFERCKEIYRSELQQAISDLPLEAQTAGNLLKGTYLEANKSSDDKMRYLRVQREVLKEALARYLDRQPFELITKEKVIGEKAHLVFDRIFDHTVRDMCEKINAGIEPEYELYNQLLGEVDIVKQVDDETLGWVTVSRVCRFIPENQKFLDEVRKIWLKRSGKVSKLSDI